MPTSLISTCHTDEPIDQCQLFNEFHFQAENKTLNGILISPICDHVQGKADYYIFCAVLPLAPLMYSYIHQKYNMSKTEFISVASIPKNKKDAIISKINALISNRAERYHWIGKIPSTNNYWYVDYQIIQSIKKTHFDTILKNRFAKLETPLKESVFVRFSNYLGRVGLEGEIEDRQEKANTLFNELKAGRLF